LGHSFSKRKRATLKRGGDGGRRISELGGINFEVEEKRKRSVG